MDNLIDAVKIRICVNYRLNNNYFCINNYI